MPSLRKLVRICLLAALFTTGATGLQAGGFDPPTGARRTALGGAYSAIQGDIWTLFHNPAGLTRLEGISGGLHLERRFLLQDLNYGAFGVAMPFQQKHVAGLDYSGSGFSLYKESRIGLSYGVEVVDRLSLGVKGNYYLVSIPEYGTASAFSVDVGLLTRISEELALGFRAFNASQSRLKTEAGEKLPVAYSAGVAWQAGEKALIVADVEKTIDFPLSFNSGLEYAFHKMFKARAGFSTYPVTFNVGVGFEARNIQVDFTNAFHERLGYTPQLSLSYVFKRKQTEEAAVE